MITNDNKYNYLIHITSFSSAKILHHQFVFGCKLNAQFEHECNQIAQYSSCSRYRTCLDTFSDLHNEYEIHQTVDDFDLWGVPNTYVFAFYREAMLLLFVFYSWLFYKAMVD